jgi:hypothetical protein
MWSGWGWPVRAANARSCRWWCGGWPGGILRAVKILVFLHGTALMHATAVGQPRAERVRQSRQRGRVVLDFAAYVPAEGAVDKVHAWLGCGAVICYLSSHQNAADVDLDRAVLGRCGFPAGTVFWRQPGESYAGVARRAGADVVMEDDCESIGGAGQTTAASLAALPGRAVTCVVAPEFGGLGHLPDDRRVHLASRARTAAEPGETSFLRSAQGITGLGASAAWLRPGRRDP